MKHHKQKSLVCRVHKHGSYVRGQHFHFESSDADKLNNVQRHKLRTKSRNGEETAVSLITNKVEAMHFAFHQTVSKAQTDEINIQVALPECCPIGQYWVL